jgi:hypothetical protein
MARTKSKVGYDRGDSLQILTFDTHTRRELKSHMGHNGDLVAELEHWAALFKTWSAREAQQAVPSEIRMALDERFAAVNRLRLLLRVTDVGTSDLISGVLLEEKHPNAGRFLRDLESQLDTFSRALQIARDHKLPRSGQPRETARRLFARQVALSLQRHGVEVNHYAMGTFGKVLAVLLRATGTSVADMDRVLKQAMQDIKSESL